jgi:hypothetical protein
LADLAVGELGEPALGHVQPGRAGGREVQVEARVPDQPVFDRRGLAGGVAVVDQVQVQIFRDDGVDEFEEAQELPVARRR